MLWPVAGVCNIAEEQRRNNAQTNTDIYHGKLNNKPVLVPRFRLLPTRKIVNPFPMMVRNERNQPSIQNQVSMLTVKGSSFSQGQEEGGGGGSLEIFGLQCAAGTLEHVAYTSVSAEFCYPIKLNFPNPSLSKDCSLISIPNPILSCLRTIPYKASQHIPSDSTSRGG